MWGPTQSPQHGLQPLGQGYVTLSPRGDMRLLKARANQAEVIQPLIQRPPGHRH